MLSLAKDPITILFIRTIWRGCVLEDVFYVFFLAKFLEEVRCEGGASICNYSSWVSEC